MIVSRGSNTSLSVTASRGRQRAPRVRKRKKSEKPASLGEMTSEEMVRKSLGIANAVELVKMVLLNAASAEVPSELVDALRRCEESHVFAAFNYLRYQEYVVSLYFQIVGVLIQHPCACI